MIKKCPGKYLVIVFSLLAFLLNLLVIPSSSFTDLMSDDKNLNAFSSIASLSLALVVLVIILVINIRQRRLSEIALKVSEDKFSKIFRSSPDWIAILRLSDGRYVDVNDAFLKMTGYERSEVIGQSALEIGIYARPEERGEMNEALQSRGRVVNQLMHFRMKSGEVRLVQRSAELIEIDGEDCLISIVRDITSQKVAERALQESERRFREMLVTVKLIAIILDRDARITFCNEYFLNMTGGKMEEVIGMDWFDTFVPREARGRSRDVFKMSIQKGTFPVYNDSEIIARNGEMRKISWSNTILRDPQGLIVGAAAIGIDITENRKLEEQLRQAQKMEAVGQLAGGVAHDFNNILTATIGYCHLLLTKMQKDDPVRFYAEQIQASFEKAASLTQSLLAFSRKQILNPQPVNINESVLKIKKLLSRLISEDIEFETDLTDAPLVVMADSGQIEQVLMNLATNAKDAMPAGGYLSIKTESAVMDRDYLNSHGWGKAGQYGLISVSDTGEGMDDYTRQRLFEPFFTTKEVGKGTGLGLSIVYGIIKQHEGFIDVYSSPGEGTTFKIYLPLVGSEVPGDNVGPQSYNPAGGTETLLVIEDNVEVRHLMKHVLEEFGYRVIEAVDGVEGVGKFREHQDEVQLMIVDVIMPRKSGKDVYDEIAGLKPGIKTIFTSGYTADIISRKGIINKGLDFVKKPLSPPELLHKVREVLDRTP